MSASYSENLARLSTLGGAADSLLDELNQQLAAVRQQNRYVQRGPGSQHQGGAMRVMKPRSAHNSPSTYAAQGRRRVIKNDSYHHIPVFQPADETMSFTPQSIPQDSTRSARPFSWHPPSQYVQQPGSHLLSQHQTQYEVPTPQYPLYSYGDTDYFMSHRQFPPTPAVYSGYASPASAFSPLSLPTTGFEQQPLQYFPQASWATMPELSPPAPAAAPMVDRLARSSTGTGSDGYSDGAVASTLDSWNTFVSRGFASSDTPPTPQDFAQAPQAEVRLQSEESIPYQPLEAEDNDKGEILYGMGLYDAPEKPADAQLQYHQPAMSSLLGSTFTCPEATGKGLKLEDAWEPPASDDEESQKGDDDDADGDSQDE
jgi:hypothetical protein